MKRLGLTLLFTLSMSLAVNADSTESELVRTEHIQKLKDYQTQHPGWDSAPSDEYVKFYKDWNDESLRITLNLHQEKCRNDSAQCLSPKQERDLRSQYRVAYQVIERQNQQSKTPNGDLITTPGEFGGSRIPADNSSSPQSPKVDTANKVETTKNNQPNNKVPETPKIDNKPKVDSPNKLGNSKPENKYKNNSPKLGTGVPNTDNADLGLGANSPKVEDENESKDKVDEKVDELEKLDPKEDELEKIEEKKEDIKIDEEKVEEDLDQFNDEEFPKNYDPSTCEWVEDLPRKIVYAPTYCSKQAAQVCTGYVVCERRKGGGKFVRMSSCSPKTCSRSKEDAIACTKEQGFYSRRPEDERNHFVSPDLKKILTAPKARAQ